MGGGRTAWACALCATCLSLAQGLAHARPSGRLGAYFDEHARLLERARALVRESGGGDAAGAPDGDGGLDGANGARLGGWSRIRRELALAPARLALPATATSLCGAAAEMARPVLQGALLDLAASGRSPLWPMLRRLGALNALLWLASMISSTLFARARWRLKMAGRARLLRAVLESEGAALGGRSTGEVVGRLERDTEQLVDTSLHGIERLVSGAAALAVALGAMLRIDARLAAFGLALRSPLALALTRAAAERVGLYGAVQADAIGALDRASAELVAQVTTVQAHGAVDAELERTDALGGAVVRVVDHTVRRGAARAARMCAF